MKFDLDLDFSMMSVEELNMLKELADMIVNELTVIEFHSSDI